MMVGIWSYLRPDCLDGWLCLHFSYELFGFSKSRYHMHMCTSYSDWSKSIFIFCCYPLPFVIGNLAAKRWVCTGKRKTFWLFHSVQSAVLIHHLTLRKCYSKHLSVVQNYGRESRDYWRYLGHSIRLNKNQLGCAIHFQISFWEFGAR